MTSPLTALTPAIDPAPPAAARPPVGPGPAGHSSSSAAEPTAGTQPWLPRRRRPVRDGLLREEDLGPVAWQVLLHDEVLMLLGAGVAVPVRARATPARRMAVYAALVPTGCTLSGRAAAWVHTGGPVPERAEVITPPQQHRAEPDPRRWPVVAEIADRDVTVVSGVRVTTLERTALDLACAGGPGAHGVLADLADAGADLAAVRTRLAGRAGHRGVRRAEALLRGLTATPR